MESNIDSKIPISCDWTFGTRSSDRAKCNYNFQNFQDFLIHYYFHCSMEKQLAIGSKYIPDVANFHCKARHSHENKSVSFNKRYQKYVANYPISCKWAKPVGCNYMSFVPYLFSCHIRENVDMSVTHCCWEKCNLCYKYPQKNFKIVKVRHIDKHLKNYSFENRSTYFPKPTFYQKSNFLYYICPNLSLS